MMRAFFVFLLLSLSPAHAAFFQAAINGPSAGGGGGGGSVPFTALHTYYLAPSSSPPAGWSAGNDSNSGLSQAAPWATPNHAVVCGDVIIVAPASYTTQFSGTWGTVSTCPSTSGGIDGMGGVYFATVLCGGTDLEACPVTQTANHNVFDVSKNNWAVEGFKATTGGVSTGGSVNVAFYSDNGCTKIVHHTAFINDVAFNSADGYGPPGCSAGDGFGSDYMAMVGDIAQNSAQGDPNSALCVAAFDIVAPMQSDTVSGTHNIMYGNFSYNNNTSCSTDVEDYMFDTWDAQNYAQQGVILNNLGWLSYRNGIEITVQAFSSPATPVFILNNTLTDGNQGVSTTSFTGGVLNIGPSGQTPSDVSQVLTITSNIVYDPTTSHSVAVNNGSHTSTTITFTTNNADGLATSCDSGVCFPGSSPYSATTYNNAGSSSLGSSAQYGTSPAFTNRTDLLANRVGVPSCTGFVNTTACMGYNALTSTLTTPSAISDLVPTAGGMSTHGYQLPSITCVSSGNVFTYYPAYLKGIVYLHWTGSAITENQDLVTKPCGL